VDVAGMDEAKEEMMEVVEFLKLTECSLNVD
jgi:ATP-dependent Zn protease